MSNQTIQNQRGHLRSRAKIIYLTQIDGPFSYCGVCGVMLVWRAKVPEDWTYRNINQEKALVTTGRGLREVHRGTVDHIMPLSQGGTNAIDNLAGLCVPCHRDKDEQRPRWLASPFARPRRRLTYTIGEILRGGTQTGKAIRLKI